MRSSGRTTANDVTWLKLMMSVGPGGGERGREAGMSEPDYGKLRQVDLFAGVGGFALALEPWCEPMAFCEIDPEARKVLVDRFPGVPIAPDVLDLHGKDLTQCDVLTAGFPCQDLSIAGKKRGLDAGGRSGLLWEILRLLREMEELPSYVLLENVTAITADDQYGTMLMEMTKLEYDCAWGSFAAKDCGAIHERRRWFLLAKRRTPKAKSWKPVEPPQGGRCPVLEVAMWDFVQKEDAVFRPSDDPTGALRKQARRTMKLLGNAVVPAQARQALACLLQKLERGSFRWPWMAGSLEGTGSARWPQGGILLQGRYMGWTREQPRGPAGEKTTAGTRQGLVFGFADATPGSARLPILEGRQTRQGVGTPRRLQGVASAPTRRTICDFGNSVAFCRDLNHWTKPQGSVVKSQFTCLAMGYPKDWTEQ